MTKKELVENALKNVKDFDPKKGLYMIIELKNGHTLSGFDKYRGEKYTKEEWACRAVSSFVRQKPSMKDEPIIGNISLNIKNIKSLKVKARK